jgi:hypothetical protein
MQWLLDPDQSDADNMKTVGREASRHFKKKEEIYERRKFHRFTVHFDSSSFITQTHALSHTIMY